MKQVRAALMHSHVTETLTVESSAALRIDCAMKHLDRKLNVTDGYYYSRIKERKGN